MTKMYKDTTHIFNGKDKPMQTGLKEIRDVLRGNQIVPPFMCWMHTPWIMIPLTICTLIVGKGCHTRRCMYKTTYFIPPFDLAFSICI